MGKNKILLGKIFNVFLVVGILIFLQIACDWKKFSVSQNNQNTNVKNTEKQSNSENPKTAATGNCQNSYHPVGDNIERKYHIVYNKNSFPAQDYTERYTDLKDDGFVAKTDFKEVNTTINWRCTTDGLLATQYNNSIDMKSGGSSKIETLKSEGVSFPIDSKWKVGEKWMTKYEVTQSIRNPNGQETAEAAGTIKQDMEITGAEDVTTPAGTFQTLKVQIKTLLDLKVNVKGVSVPTKVSLETTSWFAKDVGMVKSQTSMGKADIATTELLSFKK